MKLNKVIQWLVVGIWMGLIFYLSHQPGGISSNLSSGIAMRIIVFFEGIIPMLHIEKDIFYLFIRKAAHFFSYFMLGIFVVHALRRKVRLRFSVMGIALCISVLYAISDEVHQLFIPGRCGQVTDVLLDSCGALVGISLYYVLNRIKIRMK